MAAPRLNQPDTPDGLFPNRKPIVIGIYGLPGAGKTFQLSQLEQETRGSGHFNFYEGSQMISSLIPGGLEAFQQLPQHHKATYRQLAITKIGKECTMTGRAAIIAGHFMFWSGGEEEGQVVQTQDDLETYTHVLYLDAPPEIIAQRWINDQERNRGPSSVEHIRRWQQEEKTQLRLLCAEYGILFASTGLKPPSDLVKCLVHDFRLRTEEYNLRCAKQRLDEALGRQPEKLETVLVIDADRTLAAEDTGKLLWTAVAESRGLDEGDPLKRLFGGPLGYSYAAFRQAGLLYEELIQDLDFNELCDAVAAKVTLRTGFRELLGRVESSERVHATVVTCGLTAIWERVLKSAGVNRVTVVGCGPVSHDSLVITAEVKAALVVHLQEVHHCHVVAFGDSPLDLPMLSRADEAVVVVGDERTRSKSMEGALLDAVDNGGLRARQALLPQHVSPRLDTIKLPLVSITDPEFVASIFSRRPRQNPHQILHASSKSAAKLLMTPTRDAANAGPALREAHRRVGWYLAMEFLPDLIGVEDYPIPHVQSHVTEGYRLAHEQHTVVVALMRGGEPMAFGVNDALPLAMFLHAKLPEDVLLHHLKDRRTVLLVDSVVNNGKTAVQFIHRVRGLHPDIRIVVVAGVVQSQAVTGDTPLAHALANDPNIGIVALRLSDNKYTGKGGTDTGNRLFNTTHLA